MKSFIFFLFIILIAQSCKKDKLEGDKEIFIGKWKWAYTKTLQNSCGGGPQYYSFKDPSSENINYSIDFLKCGKVVYYENGNDISKDRIVFFYLESPNSLSKWITYQFEYIIYGDNKKEKSISGFIKSDTLVLNGAHWPHFTECPCCKEYAYFIRE
jgi:hypothetical protein